MNNMLRFEFRKLLMGKAIWICSLVLLLIIGASLLTLSTFQHNNTDNMTMGDEAGITISVNSEQEYSGKFFLSSSLSGQVSLILSVFIPLFITSDFSQGIMKTIVSRGYSRTNIVLAKSIAVIASSFILSLVAMVSACSIGTIVWGFGGEIDKLLLLNIATQMLIVCVTAYFFFSISMLIRKTGAAIATCVVSMSILGTLFSFVSNIFDQQRIEEFHMANMLSNISTVSPDSKLLLRYALICFSYLIVLFVINMVQFRKRDIE